MRLYTRTGDEGETSLFGGERVSKAHLRVEAYGAVDELNAQLGWAIAQLQDAALAEELQAIQSDLFAVGADLATPPSASESAARHSLQIRPERSAWLEALIDRKQAQVPPLTRFVLPGGAAGAAALQVCRTVCRRAERWVVRLAAEDEVHPEVLIYLNRLSDLLFVLARSVNTSEGVPEPVWEGAGR